MMAYTQNIWKPLYHESSYRLSFHKKLLGWLPLSIQDRIGMLRRYRFIEHKGIGSPIVAIVDGSTFHGGLTDRWKGIISLYAFARAIGREFKIHYVYPYDLTEFQVPAQYNWIIKQEELSLNYFTALMIRITGDTTISRLLHLPTNKQIHIYANRDCVELINQTYGTHFTWNELFNELFRPAPILQKALDNFSLFTQKPYIAVAFRMQNLLGDYPEYAYQPTNPERQQAIIDSCMRCIKQLHQKHNMRILVTSDSNRMAEVASSLPYVWTNQGKAVHVDTVSTAPEEYYLKSFVDFYLLSGAQKVYAATTPEMYVSDFPKYAALTGNIPFERILL